MDKLTDVQVPDHGLMLVFTPQEPGSYSANMSFSPGDLELDDIKFYVALGHGLMQLATQSTDDVIEVGAQSVLDMQAEVDPNLTPDTVH